MKAEALDVRDGSKMPDTVKCSCCERILTDPKQWVRSRKSVMCAACYESLLNPFPRCLSGGAAV
jgi:hypothetical protein